jgi:hypothetical protein
MPPTTGMPKRGREESEKFSTATYLRWVLLFLCVASLMFLIVKRLEGRGAIFGLLRKETEPCNTK